MIRNCFILFYLFSFMTLSAQTPKPGKYLPVDKMEKNKVLVLKKDDTFYYSDWSSGSCWFAVNATGNWKAEKDTLYLYVYYPDGLISERKFLVKNNRLRYADTNECNIVKNWGELVLEKNKPVSKKNVETRPISLKGISGRDMAALIKGNNLVKTSPVRTYYMVSNSKTNFHTDQVILYQEVNISLQKPDNKLMLNVWNYCQANWKFMYRYMPLVVQLRQYPLPEIPTKAELAKCRLTAEYQIMHIRPSKNIWPSWIDPEALGLRYRPEGMYTNWIAEFTGVKKPRR